MTTASSPSTASAPTMTALPLTTNSSVSYRSWTVPASGSGTAYASACLSEQDTFHHLYLVDKGRLQQTFSTSYWSQGVRTTMTASITTLCDGMPRVIGPMSIRNSEEVANYTWKSTYSIAGYLEPPCSIQSTDCAKICGGLFTARSSWLSRNLVTLALPVTPTVLTVADAVDTTTLTIATVPITALPTLTLFNMTWVPEGTTLENNSTYEARGYWPIVYDFDPRLVAGRTVTVSPPGVPSPFDCERLACGGAPEQKFTTQNTVRCEDDCVIIAEMAQLIRFPNTGTVTRDMCAAFPASSLGQKCLGGVGTMITASNGYTSISCIYPSLNTSSTTEADSGNTLCLSECFHTNLHFS
jgi:hypothetical protein